MKEIDIKAPWYLVHEWMPLGECYFNTQLASQAMCLQALAGGDPVAEWTANGHLANCASRDELFSLIPEALSMALIKRDSPMILNDSACRYYSSDNACLMVDFDDESEYRVSIVSNNQEVIKTAQDFFTPKITTSIPSGRVHIMMQSPEGIKFTNIGLGGIPLERNNYATSVLESYDRLINDIQSRTPTGRVAVLNGPPGGGKTYLVRGLLAECENAMFIIIQSDMVAGLANPSVIPSLVQLRKDRGDVPMVFIIEDADECLAPRSAGNMSAISAVLNLGDGILGSILDIRIVATTNAERADLDEAILRPGRLSVHMEINKLDYAQALEIYKRLTDKDDLPRAQYTLAKVYQLAKDAGWKPAKSHRKIGFGAGSILDRLGE